MTDQGFMNEVNEAMMPNEAKPNEADDTLHDECFSKESIIKLYMIDVFKRIYHQDLHDGCF